MNLKALLKQKAKLAQKMKDLLASVPEGKTFSDEQKAIFEADKKALEEVKSNIEMISEVDLDEDDSALEEKVSLAAASKVSSSHVRPGGDPAKKDFSSLEEFTGAVISGGRDARLADLYVEPKAEQRTDSGSKGGFMIPPQFRDQVLSIDPAASLVRPLAQVIPAGTPPDAEITIPVLDQAGGDIYGGVQITKVDEGGLKPETSFDLKTVTLKPHEMAGYIVFTDKLLRNWQAAKGWASKLLSQAVLGFEDTQFISGNGIGGPEGVVNAAGSYLYNRDTNGTILFGDLKGMYSRFRGNESKARWVASYSAFEKLLTITGDGGGATNIIKVDQSTGSVTIYGIPVVRHPRMKAVGTKGDLVLSDFSQYLIKDGSGPILEMGYASGQWERNKQSLKITFNVDGKLWLLAPFTDEENFQVSSSVVLDT